MQQKDGWVTNEKALLENLIYLNETNDLKHFKAETRVESLEDF